MLYREMSEAVLTRLRRQSAWRIWQIESMGGTGNIEFYLPGEPRRPMPPQTVGVVWQDEQGKHIEPIHYVFGAN